MGNWSDQQNNNKKQEEWKWVRREKLATYFFDLSKLCFSVMVLGMLISLFTDEVNVSKISLIITGALATLGLGLGLLGNKILK